MPRPGPRPYECVRRAWHSDRHHPVRGSLIQEIFRIVNEVHSLTTTNNREWQEKLPIVVLKAEEIMYSKANSEAEYSDLNTLWDRVNDAIDTIIRRDENTETGEMLKPCIEAALHLGCTPRRSSRSQRNESPRCYLRPENPIIIPIQSNNFVHSDNRCAPVQACASKKTWSIYPLYVDNQMRSNDPKFSSNSDSHIIENEKLGTKKFSFSSNPEHTSNKGRVVECDLTLRLGSSSFM